MDLFNLLGKNKNPIRVPLETMFLNHFVSEFDKIVETIQAEFGKKKSYLHLIKSHLVILEDKPFLFLAFPKIAGFLFEIKDNSLALTRSTRARQVVSNKHGYDSQQDAFVRQGQFSEEFMILDATTARNNQGTTFSIQKLAHHILSTGIEEIEK